jgi:hypothetical protein
MMLLASVGTLGLTARAADIPSPRLQSTTELRQSPQLSAYYWKVASVNGGAQLLTLFCHSCLAVSASGNDVPLVAVLRDTLGDAYVENDRLRYIWLLSYGRPNMGQRALSAVPFFYWRIGAKSQTANQGDISPLIDISRPGGPVLSNVSRDILQWTLLDPMTMPVRASTRAYRTNVIDNERLHLEEAISYLRQAPVSNDPSSLSQSELNTVIARLALRKRLLGGLVSQKRAEQLGQQDEFDQERVRSRNWEMLRQWAEKTGLIFEPIEIGANSDEYAMLWYPLHTSFQPPGTPLGPIWKLLSVRDPWTDPRLQHWQGIQFDRTLDQNGALVPPSAQGVRHVQLVPLGIYNLNYPKLPLLLVDFRDKLHLRRREVTQRTVDELATGILGLSHFANWYFYVGRAAYLFVKNRHGAALDRAERLDCYSQFRVQLALDHSLDPRLHDEMQRHVDLLAVNPLDTSPIHEIQVAGARYERLEADAGTDGKLTARLEQDRRAELANFGRSNRSQTGSTLLHHITFGDYTRRAKKDDSNMAQLDRQRRIQYNLALLDSLVNTGTDPAVANNESRIRAAVSELGTLTPGISSPDIRKHAISTIEQLKSISQDAALQEECVRAANEIKTGQPAVAVAEIAAQSLSVHEP